ncbi:hypothetical protein [Micromonospora sp. b486]|uniref:hypothetical protein n=1 Tax=Micromonospora sp. b486 TaxID=3053986 RepID=UPI00259CFD8B|nr:hypothetical protein [Micromonospora sp. b486]MDM4784591.1 hypothetical protein [Micromonospora sp. b486]
MAVRRNCMIGVTQRSSSSTATGTRSGSARAFADGRVVGGQLQRAGDQVTGGLVAGHHEQQPQAAQLRLGQRPAVHLGCASTLVRSSPGSRRRAAAASAAYRTRRPWPA